MSVAHGLTLVLLALLALSLVACRGDQEGESSATQPPRIGTPLTGVIEDGQFTSPAKGYSVTIPEGWTVSENVASLRDLRIDAFFAPHAQNSVTPSISVACHTDVFPGMTAQAFLETRLSIIEVLEGIQLEPSGTVEVDGEEAILLHYTSGSEKEKVDKTQAYFTDDRCGWVIGLTVAEGTSDGYRPVLDEFLATFRRTEQ